MKKNYKTAPGDRFQVDIPEPQAVDVVPQDIPLDVVYEDGDVIVVNKPVGLVVHPAPGHPDGTLVNALLYHCKNSLSGINGELPRYAGMIAQSENKELKQTLKQFRTACEQSQEELYQIAREKSYYVPAEKATAEEVAHVRSLFTQGTL